MASIAKDTNLAKNGKYMSGRKDNNVQLESSSAHIRKQTLSKSKDGKTQKAHSSYSEPTVTVNTSNTNVQHEKAAELKKNLEREVALGQMNDKKSIKNSSENFSDSKKEKNDPIKDEAENKQKRNKYFAYEKAKNENKYRKRVYKIEKKYRILYSDIPNANRLTILRKFSILNQNVLTPIKKGNPIGVVTAPTFVFIKKLLEKYKLGRVATRTQEASNRIVSAAENTADTSQAMSAVTQKAAKEAVKGTAGTVYRYIDRKRQKKLQENKYLKEAAKEEIAQYITNVRYIKTRDSILAQEKDFNSGKASDKLAKKIENFNKKEEQKKIKNNIKKKSKAKLLGMIAASGLSSVIPIVLVVIIIAIIASFVFYPFFYLTVTEETTDDEGNVISTEDKIEDSEIPNTIHHYHEVMNGVVSEINEEIDAIFASSEEYRNTGVMDPVKKAKYDADYKYWSDNVLSDSTLQEPKKDYWYTEDELCEMGVERGPIFEGFRWSPDTDATKVPYGKLYDEMLCTIATYNAKIMNQAGNNDIIFMDDQSVEYAYAGANFWELSNWEESVGCSSGGACCTKKVAVTVCDDEGNAVGTKYETQTYCPGHYVIMVELKLNFDLDEVWESYEFDDNDKKTYEEIHKQLMKDK